MEKFLQQTLLISLVVSFFLLYLHIRKFNGKLAAILPFLLISGNGYLSALLSYIVLIYKIFGDIRLKNKALGILGFGLVFISMMLFLSNNINISYVEICQFAASSFACILCFLYRKGDLKHSNQLLFGFYIASIIVVIAAIIQIYLLENDQLTYYYLNISKTYNYTTSFIFVGLVISPFYLKLGKFNQIISFAIFICGVLIFESRLGICFGIATYFYLTSANLKLWQLSLYTIVCCFGVFYVLNHFTDQNDQNDMFYSITNYSTNRSNILRLLMISSAFQSLTDFPIGWGVGNSDIALPFYGIMMPHPHNTYASLVFEFGLIGLPLCIIIFSSLVYSILKCNSRIQIVLLLFIIIQTFLESLFYNFNIFVLYIVILLLKFSKLNEQKPNSNNTKTQIAFN